jgi:adenosine kinase
MNPIIVSGSLAYDRIMDFPGLFRDHFVEGNLHNINISFLVDSLHQDFGGTAGNIAYTLALLGEPSTLIASVGSDFAPYRTRLDGLKIDCSLIREEPREMTAVATIMTDKGDNQIASFYPGASMHASGVVPPHSRLAIVAPGNAEDMSCLCVAYRASGTPFFFDPGQMIPALSPEALKGGMEGASIVIVNDYELSMVREKTGWDEKKILQHAKALVVTLGDKGSAIMTADSEEQVPAVPAEAKDPTGAGDAYRAGFAYGFVRNLPFTTCARIAGATAAYAVESPGTQNHRFTLDELGTRYTSAYGETMPR